MENPISKFDKNASNFISPQKNQYLFKNIKIAIIIPTFNEENTIRKTIDKIPKNLSNLLEIVVVNDGSSDHTLEIIKSIPSITILNHATNRGNGAAVRTAIEYSKHRNFDVIVTIDADGQHNIKDIPKFVNCIINIGADIVIANRYGYYYQMKMSRKIFSKAMSFIYSILFLKKISDPTNGFRAFSKRVYKKLDLYESYSTIQEILFQTVPIYNFLQLDSALKNRNYGSSFINFKKYAIRTIHSFIRYYLIPRFKDMRLIKRTIYSIIINWKFKKYNQKNN